MPATSSRRPARRAPLPAYSAVLSRASRRALLEAIERLTDDALQSVIAMMNDGRAFAETRIAGYYPFPQLPRYTPAGVRQLVVCLLVAGVGLAQPRRYERACVGEELAVNALIAHAEWEYTNFEEFLAEAEGRAPVPASSALGFDSFVDAALDDTDFAFLFDASADGRMDAEGVEQFGFANLEFADWMVAFVGRPLHPSLAPTDSALLAAVEAGTAPDLRKAVARVIEHDVSAGAAYADVLGPTQRALLHLSTACLLERAFAELAQGERAWSEWSRAWSPGTAPAAPLQLDTATTLLTLLPPALDEERMQHPLWALKAMVVACASVGWKLAQSEFHPMTSPVERALCGLIWADTERLGLRRDDGERAQAELRAAINAARLRSGCASASTANAPDQDALAELTPELTSEATPDLTPGEWWCGAAWRSAPTRADPPGAAPHPFLLA
jgi:hypothetical protein